MNDVVSFGNTTRDRVLDIKIEDEIKRAKAAETDIAAACAEKFSELNAIKEGLDKEIQDRKDGDTNVLEDAETFTSDSISSLNLEKVEVGQSKTLEFIEEESGKVSANSVDIFISRDQVSGLAADLSDLGNRIDENARNIVAANNAIEAANNAIAVLQETDVTLDGYIKNLEKRVEDLEKKALTLVDSGKKTN